MAKTGITLYTTTTPNINPNCYKITLCLAELGLEYETKDIDLSKDDHKGTPFLAINPNGRLPAIVDHNQGDLAVWESGSILLYLADTYGKGKLIPADPRGRADVVTWLMWQMAGLGPIQGQLGVFLNAFPTREPRTVDRFVKECHRLYTVLDEQLSKNEFVAGGTFSIADLAVAPWVACSLYGGIDIHQYPHIDKWLTAFRARPSFATGMVLQQKQALFDDFAAAVTDKGKYAEMLSDKLARRLLTE